jgi:hypothetical protein
MYLLSIEGRKDEGAFAVEDNRGEKVLFLFEEEDDAIRYAQLLECEPNYNKPMAVIEVDDELAIKTCKLHNYKYSVITSSDIVIPPKP